MYDFEYKDLFRKFKKKGYKKIILQFPEGLKTRAVSVADEFTKQGYTPIINADPCYGACDRLETDLADAVVQFGHTEIQIKTKTPAFFVPVQLDQDPIPTITKALPLLKGKVAVITTAQHLHTLERAVEFLKKNKIAAELPSATKRASGGQILGCSFPKGDYDTYLFIGTGCFHPIGLSVSKKKPVIIADPVAGEVTESKPLSKKYLSKRAAAIDKAKQAKAFGIIVSTKKGQNRTGLAEKLASKLPGKTYIISGNEIAPQNLLGLKIDCLVNTACPRLIEDHFHVPIISPTEVEILLGKRDFDDYIFDEIE